MKKLFALVLALCLLGSVAMADELVWAGDVETAASQIEGEFHTFNEIAIKVWIPSFLKEIELNSEDKEEGYIGYFQSEDGETAVAVQYVDMEGMTLEDFEANLRASSDIDQSSIEAGTVNGLTCLSYKNEDNGVLSFTTEKGYILEIVAGPMSTEGFMNWAPFVFASIQAN